MDNDTSCRWPTDRWPTGELRSLQLQTPLWILCSSWKYPTGFQWQSQAVSSENLPIFCGNLLIYRNFCRRSICSSKVLKEYPDWILLEIKRSASSSSWKRLPSSTLPSRKACACCFLTDLLWTDISLKAFLESSFIVEILYPTAWEKSTGKSEKITSFAGSHSHSPCGDSDMFPISP